MVYQRHYWKDYDETKTEAQNIEAGAVVTTEKLNEIENGIVANYSELDIKKSDKTYVDSMLSSIAQGGPRELFYSLGALKAKYPSGADGTYLVFDSATTNGAHSYMWDTANKNWKDLGLYQSQGIPDQAVAYAEVKDESLNYNNVDFLEVSKNRFNPDIIQPNGFHNYATGVWTSNTAFDTSGKIPCRPGQVWTSRYVRWVCYFDKNKIFKAGGFAVSGGTDELKTFTIPDGVYHFEVTCQKVNTAIQQIELGTVLSPYNSFSMEIKKLKPNINEVIDIKRDSLLIDKMKFIKQGKNLFDLEDTTVGVYVNPTTGNLNEAASYVASAMIPTYGKKISLQGIRFYALYTKEGAYLSGETITTSKSIAESNKHFWIRVSPISGLEDAAQVEYGDITEYEPYRAVLKGVKTESEFQSIPSINLPSTIYATVNKELVIFKNNILLDKGYDFRWGRGIQGELAYRETFDQVGDKTLSIEIYREGKLITSKSVLVKVNEPRSTPITAMIIGDSTVASATTEPASEARLGYHMLQEMGDNLTLVGIRGIGTSKHEGRGGWTAKDYRSNKTDQTGTNPFYNPSTQDFDFACYMENTNQDLPGLVFIQLGINDLFNYSTDEQAVTKADEFINDIKFIAANIKAYNSNIKIAYNIAIPPTEKIDVFAETYVAYNLPQWRYKRNNSLLTEKVIEELSSDSNIILNPIHKGINVFENIRDGVHPTDTGYAEIASQIVDYLNSL